MLKKFILFCLVFILIGGGIIFYKQKNPHFSIPNIPSVKGINTSRAGEISNGLKSKAEKQVMNIKISDLVNIYNRTQKIASDFRAFQDYIKKEAGSLIKKK